MNLQDVAKIRAELSGKLSTSMRNSVLSALAAIWALHTLAPKEPIPQSLRYAACLYFLGIVLEAIQYGLNMFKWDRLFWRESLVARAKANSLGTTSGAARAQSFAAHVFTVEETIATLPDAIFWVKHASFLIGHAFLLVRLVRQFIIWS